MQIFYFRKRTLKWVILMAVAIILFWVFMKVLGTQEEQSQSTLMIAQIYSMIK